MMSIPNKKKKKKKKYTKFPKSGQSYKQLTSNLRKEENQIYTP